ncbi:MAG: carboxyl transferase domain-containing protein [Pseudomonadales bacterium]
MNKLLIANRGEIAIRIAQAAAAYGCDSVAIYSEDDSRALHCSKATESVPLKGAGAAAYLDIEQVIAAALSSGADALHPGYGFLSENSELARACERNDICFVGPRADVLDQFGNKLSARQLAKELSIPVAAGSFTTASLSDAEQLMAELNAAVMVKAVSGGGGRGMRIVRHLNELNDAWERCSSEAKAAFGNGDLYVEQLLANARHVEVQVVADGIATIALGDRDCTLQHRHQKIIEIAPAPGLSPQTRSRLHQAACDLLRAVKYTGVATVEFMLWSETDEFVFIEVNPRLQVEHTITEMVTGVDIVQTQLALADGASLEQLNMAAAPVSQGIAIQSRVCSEEIDQQGATVATGGTLSAFDLPSGLGIRVDHCGYSGYTINSRFDPLLAKVITLTAGEDCTLTLQKALQANFRALCSFRIDGAVNNLPMLKNLLRHPLVHSYEIDTGFVGQQLKTLLVNDSHPTHFVEANNATVDRKTPTHATDPAPTGSQPLVARMQGTVVSVSIEAGDQFKIGDELLVLDSMKLEHVITATMNGSVARLNVKVGDAPSTGDPLLHYIEGGSTEAAAQNIQEIDLDYIRPDLQQVIDLHAFTLDENRAEKISRLHAKGKQSARENIAQLTEGGDFIEYGALAVAAQRGRRELDDLRANTPADGLVTGVGEVNRNDFDAESTRTAILAYDYSVLAGTQGFFNHEKTDRMIEVVEKSPMPLVFFAEGGGGRPGDVDVAAVSSTGLNCTSFGNLAALSGKVPMIGINAGYCFAGNAAFLGLHDIIISTPQAKLGMGGPAMIEGGGLGVVDKNDIGPSAIQVANGTIDLMAQTESEAVDLAKQYLSFFQGRLKSWNAVDQRNLRHVVPENRSRAFDMRRIIEMLCDENSVLELKPDYAQGYITSLARVEGETIAILANNNQVLSGAIDAACARKADRFLTLCERFKIRVLYLVDCPGLMVGPEYDAQGTARAAGDFYITSAQMSVPTGAIIVRKAYGLGAMAAMGGHSRASTFCISWPTGEGGPMGIEGSIRLGYRKELEAITDLQKREQQFKIMVDQAWEHTRAINGASTVEFDAVIDPAESRRWITRLLR